MITLLKASQLSGIPVVTLRAACGRYRRTKGKRGLPSKKLPGGRDWYTTQKAVEKFKAEQWQSAKIGRPKSVG